MSRNRRRSYNVDTSADTSFLTVFKQQNENSKLLKDDNNFWEEASLPSISPDVLLDIYKTVFAVSGLCRKIATSVNSGFQCQDQELLSFVRQVDHEFLLQQLALFGNAFFEVIEDGKGDIVELIPAPAQTIRILRNGVGFVQKKGIKKAYFNNFTPLVDRNEQTQRWIRSKAGITTITTGGYNPNITQMIHFRLSSVDDTYYGASPFESVTTQCLLLRRIDEFFKRSFERGLMKSLLLHPTGENTFSDGQKLALRDAIKDKLGKEFSVMIVDKPVTVTELEHNVDTNSYIAYRTELIKSLSVALNIPYDLILSDSSNRASSQVAKETFNSYTVRPIQDKLLQQWKQILKYQFPTGVDTLQHNPIDTSDEKENMEILTGYKKNGIITPNEARASLGKDAVEGGDTLAVDTAPNTDQVKKMVESSLSNIENEQIFYDI